MSERRQRSLARVRRLAHWLDSSVYVPFLRTRVGLDAAVGLLPVVGDFAGVVLSALSVGEAVRLRAPRPVVMRMLRNLGIDFVIGLVPVVGDLADIYWKATTRNLRELENWLDQPPERPRARWPQALMLGAGVLLAAGLTWWLVGTTV